MHISRMFTSLLVENNLMGLWVEGAFALVYFLCFVVGALFISTLMKGADFMKKFCIISLTLLLVFLLFVMGAIRDMLYLIIPLIVIVITLFKDKTSTPSA
ncbi:hypothetical protein [Hymenobacter sp. HDW8]|uniref:hypothetical protein n=1 Tax=Hymenobacter sp. HDW8 TaxID=2714932 RepID=UPI00140A94EF|nr:hypothetical protein [Hymenobacter sp. HDW8]QIL78434.1 hypothetical protein G7064_21680 [Hymenobacter sp. HDW8]